MSKIVLLVGGALGLACSGSSKSSGSGAGASGRSAGNSGSQGGANAGAVPGGSGGVFKGGNGGASPAGGAGGASTSAGGTTASSTGVAGSSAMATGGAGGRTSNASGGVSSDGGSTITAGSTGGTGGNSTAASGGASSKAGSTGGGTSAASGGASSTGGSSGSSKWQQMQSDFVDWRFGMFIHFGILTYTGSWAQANLPIDQFNPASLDCDQWATAAASAKMKFGVLTTRHHDGFALWPSKASTFNVGNISWRSGKGDVVQEFVTAFRAKGLEPCFYYSIWDATQNNGGNGALTAAQMQYIKTQLTELLSNYGKIRLLVLDGWAWMMGHRSAPYAEIHDLIKSLQPDILIVDHDGVQGPWDADLVVYEEPKGVFAPADNTIAAAQDNKINSSGGNDWFWAPGLGGLMSVSTIVDGHLKLLEARYTTFMLNCPPNRGGRLDPEIVTLLGQVGTTWTPNSSRAPLPAQVPLNEYPYFPASANATSGIAANAIDGVNDVGHNTLWASSTSFPQSLTL
ncbi:MAG TPA: alpha-L-fucosidase, partial [Polyangia bacterium]